MAPFYALFTGLCGFREKTRPPEKVETGNQSSSPLETKEREQTSNDLQNKECNDLQNKQSDDRDIIASDDDNNELPLPPARKAALRGTYSCNNMVLEKSGSTTKKKLSASLTIQMPRASSMAKKHDGEEDKSVRKRKLKAKNSILVRPIILGEKCRVLAEQEGGEDHSQRMPNNSICHPISLSSISISRTNSKIDMNAIPVKEKSEDSIQKEGK
ncbi:hypothetical protein EUTSA_v10005284mg [Eutrema salsugineum]|uniref:Uncharacterized protein n=1 Tax=Eutrema salsugineum TaxID=72664 RepID=V4KXM1_EUTSA|nr:hypothetical protein EUTSA_v10005284mg [Eutrema salsugineum]